MAATLAMPADAGSNGGLSADRTSWRGEVRDDLTRGVAVPIRLTNGAGEELRDVTFYPPYALTKWFTKSDYRKHRMPDGATTTIAAIVQPPMGTPPGTYTGAGYFRGTTPSGTAHRVDVTFTVDVPERPAWAIDARVAENGKLRVKQGDAFSVSIVVINRGNVPLRGIDGEWAASPHAKVLEEPKFADLAKYGQKQTLRWKMRADQPTSSNGAPAVLPLHLESSAGERDLTSTRIVVKPRG